MEKFRKQLENRQWVLGFIVVGMLLLCIMEVILVMGTKEGTFDNGMMDGFRTGLTFSVAMMGTLELVKIRKALKEETALKILYHKEHDERMSAIRSKAGMPMLQITSLTMVVAAIIAGYFNTTVFYTLVAAVLVQLLMATCVKLYCLRTM